MNRLMDVEGSFATFSVLQKDLTAEGKEKLFKKFEEICPDHPTAGWYGCLYVQTNKKGETLYASIIETYNSENIGTMMCNPETGEYAEEIW